MVWYRYLCNLTVCFWKIMFFSLHVLHAPQLSNLYCWQKLCVLYLNFYDKILQTIIMKTHIDLRYMISVQWHNMFLIVPCTFIKFTLPLLLVPLNTVLCSNITQRLSTFMAGSDHGSEESMPDLKFWPFSTMKCQSKTAQCLLCRRSTDRCYISMND